MIQILNFILFHAFPDEIVSSTTDINFFCFAMADQNWTSLINFDKVPGGIISGKEGREIEEIAIESMTGPSTSYNLIADELFAELDLLEKKTKRTISHD